MSGGSYNYLYHADSSDIGNKIDDLKDMISRLSELGFKKASKNSQTILDSVKQLDIMIEKISNVWKSVEYMDSGDWGIEEVKDEIEKYNVKTNTMSNKKQFTEKDLVKFGNYLLSDKRTELILDHPETMNDPDGVEKRLKQVTDADLDWFNPNQPNP